MSLHTRKTAAADLPTRHGQFQLETFRDSETGEPHLALSTGLSNGDCPLIRIHSECLTGDVFGSIKCDCGPQLDDAMQRIARLGCGAVIYLRQEGRGIGIEEKIRAYALQQQGLDTVDANLALGHPADARSYDAAIDWLRSKGISDCVLLTNNPDKVLALTDAGIRVRRSPLHSGRHEDCKPYLRTKRQRLGHDV